MTSRHDRSVSGVSVVLGRKPDTTATAFSFTRHVVRCRTYSIHGYCQTRHSTYEFSGLPIKRSQSNFSGGILKREQEGKHDPSVTYVTLRIVCYGNKQNLIETTDSSGVSSNFFPFSTNPIGKWCGRRGHVSARVVSRVI